MFELMMMLNTVSFWWVMIVFVLPWTGICLIVSSCAKSRAVNPVSSFFVAFLLSPVMGFLFILCFPTKAEVESLHYLKSIYNNPQ